jgi:RNA ligase
LAKFEIAVPEIAKPLGRKAYGSIGHLPNSRLGAGDHSVSEGQAKICCQRVRDRHDRVIIQEKLDGSCVAVALIEGVLWPLGRAGWSAISSPHEQHRLFAQWVHSQDDRFRAVLVGGQRLVGEWLAQAHGTRYALGHEPFVAFDIMRESERLPYDEFAARLDGIFVTPSLISDGPPREAQDALKLAQDRNHHSALDPIEGVVYRVERRGAVDYLAKYVRPEKVDGHYLPEVSGSVAVWNWRP